MVTLSNNNVKIPTLNFIVYSKQLILDKSEGFLNLLKMINRDYKLIYFVSLEFFKPV
jgi:hypothetical protein